MFVASQREGVLGGSPAGVFDPPPFVYPDSLLLLIRNHPVLISILVLTIILFVGMVVIYRMQMRRYRAGLVGERAKRTKAEQRLSALLGAAALGRDSFPMMTRGSVQHQLLLPGVLPTVGKSRKLLQMLLTFSSDVFVIADESFQDIYVSPSVEKLTGYTPDEFFRVPRRKLLKEEAYKELKDALEEVQGRQFDPSHPPPPQIFEPTFISKEGKEVCTEMVCNILLHEDGSFLGICSVIRDISLRKEAERERRANEIRYQAIARHYPNGAVILYDRELRYQYVDGAGLADVGLDPKKMTGKRLDDLFAPDLVKKLKPRYLSALEGVESVFETEFAGYTYEVSTIPVPDPEGNVEFGLVFTRNITDKKALIAGLRNYQNRLEDMVMERTAELVRANRQLAHEIEERKHTEAALRAGEAAFKAVFDTSPDGIGVYLADTRHRRLLLMDCNPAFERFSGTDKYTLMSLPDIRLRQRMVEGFEPEEDTFDSIMTMESYSGIYSWIRPDRAENVIEYKAAPVSTEQGIMVYTVDRDITEKLRIERELRESEDLLREIIENIESINIIVSDLEQDRILYHSPKYSELFPNIVSSRQQTFTNFMHALHPDDAAEFLERMEKTDTERPFDLGEFRLIAPDESTVFIRIRGFPIMDEAGRPVRIVTMVEDVTQDYLEREKRRKMEQRHQASRRLEALGNLAGGIAHDFNNFLGIILQNAELLQNSGQVPQQRKENFDRIIKASLRARDVVRRILAFSRQEPAKKTVVNPADVLREGVSLFKGSCPRGMLTPPIINDLTGRIMADRMQLNEMLVNLLVNAVDALAGRNGKISLVLDRIVFTQEEAEKLSPHGKEGEYMRIRVADTGTGISEEHMEHIFAPYFTTKEQGKGTGLGLSLVRGIVLEHEGFIHVESVPGHGTVFDIHIPALKGKAPDEEDELFQKDEGPSATSFISADL